MLLTRNITSQVKVAPSWWQKFTVSVCRQHSTLTFFLFYLSINFYCSQLTDYSRDALLLKNCSNSNILPLLCCLPVSFNPSILLYSLLKLGWNQFFLGLMKKLMNETAVAMCEIPDSGLIIYLFLLADRLSVRLSSNGRRACADCQHTKWWRHGKCEKKCGEKSTACFKSLRSKWDHLV